MSKSYILSMNTMSNMLVKYEGWDRAMSVTELDEADASFLLSEAYEFSELRDMIDEINNVAEPDTELETLRLLTITYNQEFGQRLYIYESETFQ